MDALQKEVESFPGQLENKINRAVKETTERLASDNKKNEALLHAKFDGERNVFLSKIESLEKLVQAQEVQIAELSKRNEQAYEKVQDIANRAVAASRREYITLAGPSQDKSGQGDK